MPQQSKTQVLPVIALLYTATLWGLFWYPLRLLEDAGLHGIWSTFLIYVATLPLAVFFTVRYWRDLSKRPVLLFLIAVANGVCNVAFILAVLDGVVVRVLLLFYLSPLWAVLLSVVILRERISRVSILTLIVAMVGAIIMLWDPATGTPWPASHADWFALLSGFTFAVSNVLVRKAQNISVQIKTASTWLGVVMVAGILVITEQLPIPDIAGEVYLGAFMLGAVGVVTMTIAVQYGVTNLPVQRSAVILMFELVAGVVSSQWLTNEVVSNMEWIGGVLIMTAAWFAATQRNERCLAELDE